MKMMMQGVIMAIGIFTAISGMTDPIGMAVGVMLFAFGLTWYHRGLSQRAVFAALLAGAGAFWLPGVIADPSKYALLGLIAFVLIGSAARVGMAHGKA